MTIKKLRPLDEALRRWWKWKYGYGIEEPSVDKMWERFNSYREHSLIQHMGQIIRSDSPDHLTYRVFLENKLKEVADEQYQKLLELKEKIEEMTPGWMDHDTYPTVTINVDEWKELLELVTCL